MESKSFFFFVAQLERYLPTWEAAVVGFDDSTKRWAETVGFSLEGVRCLEDHPI